MLLDGLEHNHMPHEVVGLTELITEHLADDKQGSAS
jgi:hypothetical protein